MDERLDRFGSFVVRNLRDRMLSDLDMALSGKWNSLEHQAMQERISRMLPEDRASVRDMVDRLITSGMHDILFALQEESDADGSIRVVVDGQDVAKLSDGLHGEIFGEDGWIVRHSKYPAEDQIELSRWAKKLVVDMNNHEENEDG
jgi:hypothetical protein